MSNGNSSDRLDRIERILEQNALRQERMILEQQSAQQRITSIERSVQAMLEQRASDRLKHEERMEYLEGLVSRLVSLEEGQNRMLARLDEDQPIILRKLNVIENKVDRILDRTSE